MLRSILETVFAKSDRLPRMSVAVFGEIASAVLLVACSPTPDPCGPQDTQQGGFCASLGVDGSTRFSALFRPPECGDGIRTGNEECDGEDLGGVTCEMVGAGNGTLLCNPVTCHFVFSKCSSAIVGGANTGGVSGIDGTGGTTATESCTPNAEEDEACGSCGQRNRTCQQTGIWSEWSVCDDPCGVPLCASQSRVPSWEASIAQNVQSVCGKPGCHLEAQGYDSFVSWYNTVNRGGAGLFENYLSPTHYNPTSSQTEYDALKCWISLGMPRTDAEVNGGN